MIHLSNGKTTLNESLNGVPTRINIPDSKNLVQWMGPIWQAQLGESLVMLTGSIWAPKFIALLGTKCGAH